MNTAFRTTTLALAAALGLVAVAPAMADHDSSGYERLDRLAVRLQSESRTLYYELRGHRSDAELRLAMNEVAQIYRQASHIHDGIHTGFSTRHLHRDVQSLQRLVHHVEEHLAHLRHFRRHVERMDQLTHQIDDCLHDLPDDDFHGHSYGVRPGPSGVSFGGSGFSIRIGR